MPIRNKVTENAAGTFGGSCTCPDGSKYYVGDNSDDCGSLACYGGTPGLCNKQSGVWSGRRVDCSTSKEYGSFSAINDTQYHRNIFCVCKWWLIFGAGARLMFTYSFQRLQNTMTYTVFLMGV